jgi:Spy/CpxP family protein refolding chaperone
MRSRNVWIVAAAVLLMALSSLAGPLACGHGRRGHHGLMGEDGQVDKDHLRHGAKWVLRSADPTDEQIDQIVDITAEAMADLKGLHGDKDAYHAAFSAALAGERVDRAAIESQRAAMLEKADQASRRLAAALADIGDALTPEQRTALLAEHEERRGRHRWH